MTAVDARFAGGPILVERSVLDGHPVVDITLPGGERVPLFLHEADRLADALRDRGEVTVEGFARDEATDHVVLLRDGVSGRASHIMLDEIEDLELDRDAALAFATRLIELAAQLPEPAAILQRRGDVDEHLRRSSELH